MDLKLLSMSDEFWSWLETVMNYERAIGCQEENIENRRDHLMRAFLYMAPVAGSC